LLPVLDQFLEICRHTLFTLPFVFRICRNTQNNDNNAGLTPQMLPATLKDAGQNQHRGQTPLTER